MKNRLILTKWFYYALIAVALIIAFCFTVYQISLGNDMATRFLPTIVGLMVTVVIFYTFFDWREDLEWKEVEDRVRKRIGREIFSLFTMLTGFCKVDRNLVGDADNIETRKELHCRQLKQMTEKVVLNEIMVAEFLSGINRFYPSLFESNRNRLSQIEDKYGRFLNPKLKASLMDIQEFIEDFGFEMKPSYAKETIKTLIEKIAKEIDSIRDSGIDIGF